MLSVVKRTLNTFQKSAGDVAGLQTQISKVKAEGAEGLAELDRLQAERAAAEDYDRVRAIDDNTKRAQS